MGFFSSICSGICNFVSGAVRVVADIGAKVVAVAEPLVTILAKVAPTIGIPLVGALNIAKTVVYVASVAVGIMDKTESVEELGERALEAAEKGIRIDDYDNTEDYLRDIREIPLNENREKYSDEDRSLAGICVLGSVLRQKIGLDPDLFGLFVQYKDFFTEERVQGYIKYAEDTGCSINDMRNFFSSNTTFDEREQAYHLLVDAEKSRVHDFNSDAFDDELYKAKTSSQCVL